ncbi:hypothetical protein DSM104443_02170 [Usitatibacter rugosus]|uniref:Poly(Hydroxyalkanoate) granule-associated protein n=1 Tax=Usitatibacter rugosus TaxID=2732067 RepID=A0A6M4GUW2_9PROT|nr:phasin family protein [Usitatibacter rugosus]QJR11099.1 hypothetical protein DSM104443_02170 [Usitatibacter rugosus]
MATRKKKSSRRSASRPADLAGTFAASGQKIWLAGLGAYERARKEGPKMFDMLVTQGKALRGQAAAAADQALKNVRAQAESASSQAAGKWDKLEQVFEDRVSKAVHKLGVVTGKDVDALMRQVNDLTASVRSMSGKPAAKKAKRPAAKKAKKAKKKPAAKAKK